MNGKTTIAMDVLTTIARLTVLNVPGVSRLSTAPGRQIRGFFKRGEVCEGVCVSVQDDIVDVELYIVLLPDLNIREVSRNVQREVSRAISEMVGMQVGRIDIHVEDIDYPENDGRNVG